MPVPVSATNPGGKGLQAATHSDLPSKGSLFSRLGADTADAAMEDKKQAMAVDKPARRANQNGATQLAEAPSNGGPSIVCDRLQFRYVGDDGLPIPGAAVHATWLVVRKRTQLHLWLRATHSHIITPSHFIIR